MKSDGYFFDGQSAVKHAVSITVIGTEIVIQSKTGQVVAKWPLHEVDLLPDGRRDNHLQLTNAHFPDARLTVEDPSLIRRLSTLLPKVFGKRLRRGHIWLHVAVTLAVVVATATVFYFAIPSLTKPLAALVPHEWERTLGESVVTSIPGAQNSCTEANGARALARLTERLTGVMDLPYPVDVSIAEIDMANAFAAPGGFIVVGNKLIAEMHTAEELAGVVAHEMAHIAERHPMSRVVRVLGISLLLEIFSGGNSGAVEAVTQGASLLLMFSHSRDDERDADRIAVQALEKAGIRADGLSTFFARMDEKHKTSEDGSVNTVLSWLSTHPSFAERKASTNVPMQRKEAPAMSSAEWHAIGNICS